MPHPLAPLETLNGPAAGRVKVRDYDLSPGAARVLAELAKVPDMRLAGPQLTAARALERAGLATSLAVIAPLPRGRGEIWAATRIGHEVARELDASIPWTNAIRRAIGMPINPRGL